MFQGKESPGLDLKDIKVRVKVLGKRGKQV